MIPYIVVTIAAALSALLLLWPARKSRAFFAGGIVLFTVLSLSGYHYFGNPEILPLLESHDARQKEARAVILAESENIKKDSRNIAPWIKLGLAFSTTQQWNAAANAYKQAVLLSEGHPEMIMAYARSMIMDEGGKVSDKSKKSLEMVLLQKPEHPEARYYMNVRLLQDGKTEEAMKGMKELYRSLPENSPVKAMINEQIGR